MIHTSGATDQLAAIATSDDGVDIIIRMSTCPYWALVEGDWSSSATVAMEIHI